MTKLSPAMAASRGPWSQRIGYGMADFASNLIWQVITLFLMYFYTDVVGLIAVQVGILFLVTRLVDGVADITMGIIIDKTKSKWGKSRPWFLWGAFPFGFFGIATFYMPKIGPTGELIYAFITYLGLSLVYTVVNIPLSSILPSLTRDAQERTMLATTRIIFAILGSGVVNVCTRPLVKLLGGNSPAAGFFWTMVIFAGTGTAMFIYTFFHVEEKVKVRQQHLTVKQAFSSFKGNTPWLVFAINIVFMWSAYFFQQGAMIYYFTYNVGQPDLFSVAAGISAFVPAVGTFTAPFLGHRFHKRTTFMIASTVNLIGIFIMIFANIYVPLLLVGLVISAIGFGLRTTIYFSMQADPVDYGEWKTGVSAPGILSSTNGFIGKVAMAVSGAISGWMLTASHYVPNHHQTDSALFAIKLNYLIIPAVMVVISMIVMSFYNLDKIYPKIRAEIDAREKAHIL
jgi:GPH family glycoside/pentoside/hexuronide:cation symporter